MSKAYGFVEITGVTAAVTALDIMCKAAAVKLVTWERKLGGRLVTLVIEGSVGAVQAAVEAACGNGIKKPVVVGVLPNPHEEIIRLVNQSAKK
jgi:microcompartment protein CcmL/EutN